MDKMDGTKIENGELRMEKLDGKSKDITAENIQKLKELFPEAFTEGKVDFEALKEVLGTFVDDRDERYSFTWNGKSKARMIAQTPSTGTLRPCKEESVDWDATQNIFIEGDNLEVLKLLQKSYHKKVKMIYIDPPYNTGKDFVYKDNFKDNIKNYKEITGQVDGEGRNISNNPETSGRYHTDWLNMIYPRLKLARNMLKDDGVIFISIDENEAFNLKKVCDELFGEENYVGEIIWQKRKGGGNDSRYMAIDHEIIFIFCKDISTQEKKWRIPYAEEYLKRYREEDENGRFYWDTLHRGGLQSPIIYDVVCPDGSIIKNGTWQVSETSFKEKQVLGQIRIIPSREGGKWTVQHKVYQPEGRVFRSIFADVSNTDSANEIKNLFGVNKFFDNPKPIGLITQLINMCNVEKEDVIFDFFAGSATSAHALLNLNINDNTSRKFIMVQLPELCDEKSEAFKSGYKTIAEIGKERIRRAAAKIKEDNPEYEGDLGFKVFKLDSTNIKPWEVDFDMTERTLEDFISNIKTDRREEDVLYEVLLKYGLDLTLPITEHTIAGQKVFDIGMGALIICLSDVISLEVVEGIANLKDELKPEIMRVVFKDSGFKDDVVKTNAVQILKQAGIVDVKSI